MLENPEERQGNAHETMTRLGHAWMFPMSIENKRRPQVTTRMLKTISTRLLLGCKALPKVLTSSHIPPTQWDRIQPPLGCPLKCMIALAKLWKKIATTGISSQIHSPSLPMITCSCVTMTSELRNCNLCLHLNVMIPQKIGYIIRDIQRASPTR